jgi:hypothetical protein
VNEYKVHIRALETEFQELAEQPVLNQGSCLQALFEELTNEKQIIFNLQRRKRKRKGRRKTEMIKELE